MRSLLSPHPATSHDPAYSCRFRRRQLKLSYRCDVTRSESQRSCTSSVHASSPIDRPRNEECLTHPFFRRSQVPATSSVSHLATFLPPLLVSLTKDSFSAIPVPSCEISNSPSHRPSTFETFQSDKKWADSDRSEEHFAQCHPEDGRATREED